VRSASGESVLRVGNFIETKTDFNTGGDYRHEAVSRHRGSRAAISGTARGTSRVRASPLLCSSAQRSMKTLLMRASAGMGWARGDGEEAQQRAGRLFAGRTLEAFRRPVLQIKRAQELSP